MKFKHLALALAFATGSFSMLNNAAYAEEAAAVSTSAEDGEDLKMFRFALRMDRLEFIKSAMQLDEAQEQKFLEQYDRFDIELKALHDERLAIIEEYAANFDKITDKEADVLVKRSFDFRKKRTALLEKYYQLVAKATSKVIAARFLQVESVLQGTADVTIGSSIPLMAK
ncbi:hypothetical protein A1359_00410 [Methylomonas lenta]|uniref:Uncharacterized protein n=1 Tax=Methylomonas lenta TaxID=980561 RepID=A0A177NHX1_9GAMM|nr:hypothetical protein [Methylomonas lenta]OAI17053.1 hypothetical protein A1359_00410 [Methylomonas lenta]